MTFKLVLDTENMFDIDKALTMFDIVQDRKYFVKQMIQLI